MITEHTHGKITWLDVFSPSSDEMKTLLEQYDLNPLVAEELMTPSIRSKVDHYESYIFLVLHFPAITHSHDEAISHKEVDCVILKDTLITVRYDEIASIHQFSKEFEVTTRLHSDLIGHAGFLFYYLMKEFYASMQAKIELIGQRIIQVEDEIFKGKNKKMVEMMSHVNRNLLNMTHITIHHRDVLESLEQAAQSFFDKQFAFYIRSLSGDYARAHQSIQVNTEFLEALRKTNDSLLTTKQNGIITTLTILAFIALPLTAISSIFNLNTNFVPIIGHQYDFWIIVGIMVLSMIILFWLFKHKKWI